MTYEDGIFICLECVREIRYKKLIENLNVQGLCTCCGSTDLIIDADSEEFVQMTKALIRYHYSEWDYNHHFGGDDIVTLFSEDCNIFLNKQNFNNSEVYEELLNRIDALEGYEEYEKGVSLFAGYYKGEQIPLLESIKSLFDNSVTQIASKLKTENYFKFEDQIIGMLTEYSKNCSTTVKEKAEFYRARVGYAKNKRDIFTGGFEAEMVYEPYSDSDIGAPPPHLAGDGRINRIGVSYLYCSTDKYTAISEIRPHPGDLVSIGKFIAKKSLLVFDMTPSQFVKYYKSDENLSKYTTLNTFTELLQKVIPPSEKLSYNITQLIADCIRKLNFDGILFPSSVGDGENLVVFDPKNMSYTSDDSEVVEINKVSYDYFKRRSVDDINEIESL